MRILIHSINFWPELTGIGKYTGELAEWLSKAGHEVRVVTAPPYYPQWRVAENFSGRAYRREQLLSFETSSFPRPSSGGCLTVYRCPLWVPRKPSGIKRLAHLASFAVSSFPIVLSQVLWRPDVVLVIEPPFFCAPQAWLLARLSGGKAWLHVQDFEIDAAFELGLLRAGWVRHFARRMERFIMCGFDRVSTISGGMQQKLLDKGLAAGHAVLLPNWVDTQEIFPLSQKSTYRAELGLDDAVCVALYSGNMGEKQGLETVLEAACLLQHEPNLLFVLCGEGAAQERLMQMGSGFRNVRWLPLQPMEKLNELLNLADIHLLPQRADVADLVMPSKLLGMLASGKAILATAHPETQLAKVVSSCGKVVDPGNAQEVARALLDLLHAPQEREQLGLAARQAAQTWEKTNVLRKLEGQLYALCNKP